ncbi:MAG: HD domain-containing protein [Candidatus Sericytochromatia bacterium]|nr:HD domain-containing protein [Candidatus Tanganyikabacteria bacterium]
MLSRDLMQPGTWIPILKAGSTLTPELIAKIRRLGLERVALSCIDFRTPREPAGFPPLLLAGEVATIEEIVAGRGNQGELRQVVYDAARRLAQPRRPVEFRLPGAFELQHPINVFSLALVLGHALDYGPAQLVSLGTGALLHDIGKTLLPDRLVGKTGPLSPKEAELLRHHPALGVALLTRAPRFARWLVSRDAVEIVRHHHERFDGTGYPDKLRGAAIPRMASIVAVADVYDAMLSDRPYARRSPPGVARQTIRSLAGRQFDPAVVDAFLRRILPYPTGTEVVLSDRRVGRVLRATSDAPLRPLVGVAGEEIDLAQHRRLDIVSVRLARRGERVSAVIPVRIGLGAGAGVWGKTVDVSAEGACIDLVGGRAALATDVELQFCTGGATTGEPLKAKICWVREGGDGTSRIGVHVRGADLLAALSAGRLAS